MTDVVFILEFSDGGFHGSVLGAVAFENLKVHRKTILVNDQSNGYQRQIRAVFLCGTAHSQKFRIVIISHGIDEVLRQSVRQNGAVIVKTRFRKFFFCASLLSSSLQFVQKILVVVFHLGICQRCLKIRIGDVIKNKRGSVSTVVLVHLTVDPVENLILVLFQKIKRPVAGLQRDSLQRSAEILILIMETGQHRARSHGFSENHERSGGIEAELHFLIELALQVIKFAG